MTKGLEDKKSEELNRWVASFVNNVMFSLLWFLQMGQIKGRFLSSYRSRKAQFGIKTT